VRSIVIEVSCISSSMTMRYIQVMLENKGEVFKKGKHRPCKYFKQKYGILLILMSKL